MSEKLDEETKDAVRALAPEKRAALRDWFADSPHYTELVEFLNTLDRKEAANG